MVSLIGLLRDFHRLALTDYEIADLAWEVERLDLGLKGGLQDQYAAAFGGFNFIEFHSDGVIVNPLRIPRTTIDELEANLLLCFTGTTRAGDTSSTTRRAGTSPVTVTPWTACACRRSWPRR